MSFDSNCLQLLCLELNFKKETTKETERLCNLFLRNNSIQQPLYLYISSCIGAALITKSFPSNFYSNIFKNICSPEDFISFSSVFVKTLEVSVLSDYERIIENYAFSWRLYKKFIEK